MNQKSEIPSELKIKKQKLYDILCNIADECERAENLAPKVGLIFILGAVCSFFLVDNPKYFTASIIIAVICGFIGMRFLRSSDHYKKVKTSINGLFSPPPIIQKKMTADDYVYEVLNGENKMYIDAQLVLQIFYDTEYKGVLTCPVRLSIPTKLELIWSMREAHPECQTVLH